MDLRDAKWSFEYDGDDFDVNVGSWVLRGQSWTKTACAPKFIYVFVHGLGATITFKKDFYPIVNSAGGVVFACDHVGHGRSPGTPGSCLISENVEETIKVIQLALSKYPSLPVFLHGHSMGGLTVLSLVMRNPGFATTNLAGIIAEAPWISACPQRPVGCCLMAMVRVANKIIPNLMLNSNINVFSSELDKKFVEMCASDKYHYDTLTPRLYISVDDEIAFVRSNIDLYPSLLPMLFMQGKKDDVVDPEMNETWIEKLLNEAKEDSDISYKRFDNGPHVILKSPCRSEAIQYMMNFIEHHISKSE